MTNDNEWIDIRPIEGHHKTDREHALWLRDTLGGDRLDVRLMADARPRYYLCRRKRP